MAHTNDTAHSPTGVGGAPKESAPLAPTRLVASYTSGGHESDRTPNRNLFGFLMTLIIALVLTGYGVDVIFSSQANRELERAAKPSMSLVDRATKDEAMATTYGEAAPIDGKNKAYRIPFAAAKALVLSNPARFQAAPPPKDWKHPDDTAPAKPN